jgi:serine/threonine protein kinase
LQVCIAIGLFDALAYLHGRGMLHRDVKAANIFLDEHMKPKLGDVGISRILQGDTGYYRWK